MKGVPPKSKWGRILLICNVIGWHVVIYLWENYGKMSADIFFGAYAIVYLIVYFSLAKHYNNDRDQEEKKDKED